MAKANGRAYHRAAMSAEAPRQPQPQLAPQPAPQPVRQQTIAPATWGLLLLLACIWGGSFLSNRLALEEVGVLTTVAFRVGLGAAALWLWIAARRLPLPRGPGLARRFLLLGLVNNALPFSLIVWGQQHIPSGLAGILNAATAVFAVLLAAAVFPDERLSLRKAAGVAVGFAGVATAIGRDALAALDVTSLGQLAIIGSSVAYAVGTCYSRVALRGIRPEVASAGMLTSAALFIVPLALWHEGLPDPHWRLATWGALAYLALMASAFAYILYYAVLTRAGAGNLGLVTLLVAPVAILLGALVYGEALHPADYAGFAILATGLMILDGRPRRLFAPLPAPPAESA